MLRVDGFKISTPLEISQHCATCTFPTLASFEPSMMFKSHSEMDWQKPEFWGQGLQRLPCWSPSHLAMLLLGDWKRPFDHTDQLEDSSAPPSVPGTLPSLCCHQDACHHKGFHCVLGDREKARAWRDFRSRGLPPEIVLEMVGLEWFFFFGGAFNFETYLVDLGQTWPDLLLASGKTSQRQVSGTYREYIVFDNDQVEPVAASLKGT